MAALSRRFMTPFISRYRAFSAESVALTTEEEFNLSSHEEEKEKSSDKQIFENLLRNSKLVSSGTFLVGQKALGQIVAVSEGNIYVDFGGKFHGVIPQTKALKDFHKGSMIEIRVKDLEVTTHFLGSPRDSSLLEAEIELANMVLKKTEKPRVDY